MSIYIAAGFGAQRWMRSFRDELVRNGHEVTSRWLDDDDRNRAEILRAVEDIEDIDRAEIFLFFASTLSTRGGRHVELGYAMAREKRLIRVGLPTNAFEHLPMECIRYPLSAHVVEYLSEERDPHGPPWTPDPWLPTR